MRWTVIAAVLATAALMSLPAVAQDAGAKESSSTRSAEQPAADTAATATASADELVCRMEQETGSRFRKKVCRPRDAVEADARESELLMKDAQRAGALTTAKPGR